MSARNWRVEALRALALNYAIARYHRDRRMVEYRHEVLTSAQAAVAGWFLHNGEAWTTRGPMGMPCKILSVTA